MIDELVLDEKLTLAFDPDDADLRVFDWVSISSSKWRFEWDRVLNE